MRKYRMYIVEKTGRQLVPCRLQSGTVYLTNVSLHMWWIFYEGLQNC